MKYQVVLFCCFLLFLMPGASGAQHLVKILVATPAIENDEYMPIADVIAGTIIRELKRNGGMEILDRETSENLAQENGGKVWIGTRVQAETVGKKMNADFVILTIVSKNNKMFNYRITFFQVNADVIQQELNGAFDITYSASEIGRVMKKEALKLVEFVPLPSELENPSENLLITMIDPDKIPQNHEIEGIPDGADYGTIEQVLSYYRVFPGQEEFDRLAQGTRIMRLHLQREMDQELTDRYNLYNVYGEFAARQKMQAYFIENCSTKVISLLIANNIPVFCLDEVIMGYTGLMSDGYCIFRTLNDHYLEATDLTYHDRMVVMFFVPSPGRKFGISREYLESALSMFQDEWDEPAKLVEITEGMIDTTSPTQ